MNVYSTGAADVSLAWPSHWTLDKILSLKTDTPVLPCSLKKRGLRKCLESPRSPLLTSPSLCTSSTSLFWEKKKCISVLVSLCGGIRYHRHMAPIESIGLAGFLTRRRHTPLPNGVIQPSRSYSRKPYASCQ